MRREDEAHPGWLARASRLDSSYVGVSAANDW